MYQQIRVYLIILLQSIGISGILIMISRYRVLVLFEHRIIIPSDMTIRMFKYLTERTTLLVTYGMKESDDPLSLYDMLVKIKPEKEF